MFLQSVVLRLRVGLIRHVGCEARRLVTRRLCVPTRSQCVNPWRTLIPRHSQRSISCPARAQCSDLGHLAKLASVLDVPVCELFAPNGPKGTASDAV
jgi:hypothetical protein